MKPPIFIFGVPRSGTTLLRTILNSHPHIASGPEAPWLAHQAQGIMALEETLTTGEYSFSRNFGVSPEAVTVRIRELVDGLFTDFATLQGKIRWAHKTPDDSLHVDFFTKLFPEGKFIHLVRNPLDVALSTNKVAAHRAGISEWHEANLVLEAGVAVKKNLFNSVLRWRRWDRRITTMLSNVDHFSISYEEMTAQPIPTFTKLFEFLDEPFDPAFLDYQSFPQIFPSWEWGSADVKQSRTISTQSVARWKNECSPEEAYVLSTIAGMPLPHELNAGNLNAETLGREVARGITEFSESLSLEKLSGSETAGFVWLWLNELSSRDWPATKVIAVGSGHSPLPWLLALLGAKVSLVAPLDQWTGGGANLQRVLRVDVQTVSLDARSDNGDLMVITSVTGETAPELTRRISKLTQVFPRVRNVAILFPDKNLSEVAGLETVFSASPPAGFMFSILPRAEKFAVPKSALFLQRADNQ